MIGVTRGFSEMRIDMLDKYCWSHVDPGNQDLTVVILLSRP